MLATMQVIASVSCWPRRCDHERHQFRGLRVASRTSPVGRSAQLRTDRVRNVRRSLRKKKINSDPAFPIDGRALQTRPPRHDPPLSQPLAAIGHQRRAAREDNPGDEHQSSAWGLPAFRPRRAANSSTALLNTRQVAATHPAIFAGLTAVGFRGHMMRHAARSSLGFSRR
jgi:hypothetical protein